jgi:hypothetical protein
MLQFRWGLEGASLEGVTAKHISTMSFSTEALVAAFLAIVFAALSVGAIVREQGGREPFSTNISAASYVSTAGSRNSANDDNALGFY